MPPKMCEKILSANFYVKFGHFSAKNHVKLGNFVNFSGKYQKFGYFDKQFVIFSYIFFRQKCCAP